jgi:hypothetical protein
LSWGSISRQRKHSASRFRNRFCCGRMRWSNDRAAVRASSKTGRAVTLR